jgi:hypothetical protein
VKGGARKNLFGRSDQLDVLSQESIDKLAQGNPTGLGAS